MEGPFIYYLYISDMMFVILLIQQFSVIIQRYIIYIYIKHGVGSYIVQLDFSATFDRVSHCGLLFKLK